MNRSLFASLAISLALTACTEDPTPPAVDMGATRDMSADALVADASADQGLVDQGALDAGALVDGGAADLARGDAGPLLMPEMVSCDVAPAAQTVHATVLGGFVANDLTVAPGDTVKWINDDLDMEHTVWGGSPGGEVVFAYSLPIGATLCVQFFSVSDYPYNCYFHPSMTGTVRVR